MGKAKYEHVSQEVIGTVRGWAKGGAYVSVPRSWMGKKVLIKVIPSEEIEGSDYYEIGQTKTVTRDANSTIK